MGTLISSIALALTLVTGNGGAAGPSHALCHKVQVGWTAPVHEVYEDGSEDWIAYPIVREVCPITHTV